MNKTDQHYYLRDLTLDDINVILASLGEQPAKLVYFVMKKVKEQIEFQMIPPKPPIEVVSDKKEAE